MAESRTVSRYAAVSVEFKEADCCAAAQQLAGQRFLAAEAPHLPLENCDRYAQCRCRYKKWDDRRQEDRRMTDIGIANQYFHGDDQRTTSRGRREED